MKYIKTYEKYNNKLKKGYYVKIKEDNNNFTLSYNQFLSNHIGKIVDIACDDSIERCNVYVNFILKKNEGIYDHTHPFSDEDIEFFSDNIEDLKRKIDINKYNL